MSDREWIRDVEGVRNNRFLALAGLAVLACIIVLSSVFVGFRGAGNQVRRSSNAMALEIPASPRLPAPPYERPVI
jgi:hypothetical protein